MMTSSSGRAFLLASLLMGFILSPCFILGQHSAQLDIDEQLWRPFMQAYAAFDADGFLALHLEDAIRISQDGPTMFVGEDYRSKMHNSFRRLKQAGLVRQVEMSFTRRLIQENAAQETGVMKITTTRPGGQPEVLYTRFEFILRKKNGHWLIAVDQDQAVEATLGAQQFANGQRLF